jgi:hypothetical protein
MTRCTVISKEIDERKMDYRGSKSDGASSSVKEQRADASSYVFSICKVRSSRHESGS